jgi:hypothetical protein
MAMRSIPAFPALVLGVQLCASDLQVVVRTTDAVVVSVSVLCPGDSALVPGVQYEFRLEGTASWRAVGGVPPYTLLAQQEEEGGMVCFTVVDAIGHEATGCGVIGERHTERVLGCNGSRSPGIPRPGNAPGKSTGSPAHAVVSRAFGDDLPGERPRVGRYSVGRREPTDERPPVLREERWKDVHPPTPIPSPRQRDVLRVTGGSPQPTPQRTTNSY